MICIFWRTKAGGGRRSYSVICLCRVLLVLPHSSAADENSLCAAEKTKMIISENPAF